MTVFSPTAIIRRPERRFSVAEYLRMVSEGILTKNDRVELIEGRIVEKMATDPPHEATLYRIHDLLKKLCPPEWLIMVESTLQLDTSAPEPDAYVVRGPIDRYDDRHPQPSDALLVIEISDTTVRDDRHEKGKLYAASRVSTYWIVNLESRRIEIYSDPTGPDAFPAYRHRVDVEGDGTVSLEFPEGQRIQVAVRDILPKSKSTS